MESVDSDIRCVIGLEASNLFYIASRRFKQHQPKACLNSGILDA